MRAPITLTLTLTLLAALAAPTVAQTGVVNTTREFRLRTVLKPGQFGKAAFDGLYVSAYHTGAGTNDAVLSAGASAASLAFLNGTLAGGADANNYSAVGFDLGTTFPWVMQPELDVELYAAWQPVTINLGEAAPSDSSAFFVNATGLQWSSSPAGGSAEEFGGWLVCDWWHLTPQLFFRISFYLTLGNPPESCADVYLIPEYV